MNNKFSILVVEDEKNILNFICATLEANGYQAIKAFTGKQALMYITSYCPDLVILDLGLPDMDGGNIIIELRKWSQMPLIVVSARTSESDKVEALDAGADDYLTKPFGTQELIARVRTALRHSRTRDSVEQVALTGCLKVRDLTIDLAQRIAFINEVNVHLTQIEFKLLSLLAKQAGRVLTYDYLIKNVWGPNADSTTRTLRVNMANIRRKIEENPAEPQYIFTEIGVGYKLADE
ncbi:MAG: response regulator transcription factor [Sphaerochaetaceae bacterium]|nr:response regulator transcription factor [Sphaerochaetaceae bacterium]